MSVVRVIKIVFALTLKVCLDLLRSDCSVIRMAL